MTVKTVAISVDCICAAQGKCYVSEVVAVAEKYTVPLTWLLGVTEHEPMANVKLYHNEYLHRIPAWHELGLYLDFDSGSGNTVDRGDLIRIGKDMLKQFSIKPTAYRAANGDLRASDLAALEDIGILVDSTPGSSAGQPPDAPFTPYHPARDSAHKAGDSSIWVVPVANLEGARAYIDEGFDRIKPIIDHQFSRSDVLSIGMRDCGDNAIHLGHVIDYLKKQNVRFATLTQLAAEL